MSRLKFAEAFKIIKKKLDLDMNQNNFYQRRIEKPPYTGDVTKLKVSQPFPWSHLRVDKKEVERFIKDNK